MANKSLVTLRREKMVVALCLADVLGCGSSSSLRDQMGDGKLFRFGPKTLSMKTNSYLHTSPTQETLAMCANLFCN